MRWNPQTLRWEGNDHVLRDFDMAVGTSTRPALITHITGSSIGSPLGSFASGARIVGNMVFDPGRHQKRMSQMFLPTWQMTKRTATCGSRRETRFVPSFLVYRMSAQAPHQMPGRVLPVLRVVTRVRSLNQAVIAVASPGILDIFNSNDIEGYSSFFGSYILVVDRATSLPSHLIRNQ
jgi:hypothetical protein